MARRLPLPEVDSMCGRFAITLSRQAMAQLLDALPGNDVPDGPRFNVCPTNTIAVCTSEEGARRLRGMRWGLIPRWAKSPEDGPLLINARAETVAEKPAFRDAIRHRRCLIPADGFYEWAAGSKGERLPFWVSRTDGASMTFAGLWQEWHRDGQQIASCAIVTGDAGTGLAAIHDREPVLIEAEDWPLWLGEAGPGAALLMKPRPEGVLQSWRVGTEVNSNRAEGPQLREPVG